MAKPPELWQTALAWAKTSPDSGGSLIRPVNQRSLMRYQTQSGQVALQLVKFASNGLAGAAPALAAIPRHRINLSLKRNQLGNNHECGWTVSQDASA